MKNKITSRATCRHFFFLPFRSHSVVHRQPVTPSLSHTHSRTCTCETVPSTLHKMCFRSHTWPSELLRALNPTHVLKALAADDDHIHSTRAINALSPLALITCHFHRRVISLSLSFFFIHLSVCWCPAEVLAGWKAAVSLISLWPHAFLHQSLSLSLCLSPCLCLSLSLCVCEMC